MGASKGLEIGVGVPSTEGAVAAAVRAEEAGFDRVFCGEHVFFHGPVPNAFVVLGAAAAATERIRLLSGITLLPLYPPALAAKMASTLDVVSAGRFDFGVGVGGEYPAEFEAVGVPVSERGRRTDEALAAIGHLFAAERASFEGRWTSFSDVGLDPRPAQPDGPPIWIAGRGEAAMRRAARFADVWMPYMYTPEMLAESVATVAAQTSELGRPDPVATGIYAFVCVDRDGELARRRIAEAVGQGYQQDFRRLGRYLVAGTPAECSERLREYVDAGARRLNLQLGCPAEHYRECLEQLIDGVLPELKALQIR